MVQFDDQAQRVYNAESCCSPATYGRHFQSLAEIEAWLLDLTGQRWFQRRFPAFERVQLHDGRGITWAQGWLAEDGISHINLPRAMRSELYVLHELAHGLGQHSHDREFCATYLTLVHFGLGRDAANDLKREFVWWKVRHRRFPIWQVFDPDDD